MTSYNFGQVTVSSNQFYEAIYIDITTLNVHNIVVSDPITDGKKGTRYNIGCNIDHKIIACCIKTPNNVYSNVVSKYSETSKWTIGFNLEGRDEWIEK